MHKSPSSIHRSDRGFILVAVLWLAGLIAALATGFMLKVRIEALTTANVNQNAQSEYVADGMARLTGWRLAVHPEQFSANARSFQCVWNDRVTVAVTIQDQAGLADLNTMPPVFFETLFQKLGAAPAIARDLSLAMVDFRDADSVSMTGAAEPETYPERDFGPKNSPFQAIEEIDQLPGMDEALYRKLLPLVTVYSSQPGIEPLSAPQELKRMFGETTDGVFTGELAPYQGSSQRKTFGIDVRVTNENGSRFRRKVIAVVLQQPEQPFVFLEWQRGDDWPKDNSPKATAPCLNQGSG
jgi:general secretion pathway protein K